jgi:heterodisulfide reductase subunit A
MPQRLSDGKKPKKVAFIQCVGSRDMANGREYCSSVCCMYATKQAMVSKERIKDLDTAVFYMDIRAMGKNYERYYEKAKVQHGVRYIRSAVSCVRQLQQSKNLVIAYGLENGEIKEEEFDIVVLSVGFVPPESVKQAAAKLGIELNQYGFCKTDEFNSTATSVPGIFVAGAFREPRDIPETVVDASAAAADVSALLDTFEEHAEKSPEPTRREQLSADTEPRIGVFICDNKGLLATRLDIDDIATRIANEQNVVCAQKIDVTSLEEGQKAICSAAGEKKATHVILAGYKRRELSRALEKECKSLAGAPGRIDYANIGEQCADVHGNDKTQASVKAESLIRSIVRKMRRALPRMRGRKKLQSRTLVIGGGVAGLTSSLSLADQGMNVTLVEKTDTLGGNALEATRTLKGSDIQQLVKELVARAESHANIEIIKNAELASCTGTWGSFKSTIERIQDSGVRGQDSSDVNRPRPSSSSSSSGLQSQESEIRNPKSEIEKQSAIAIDHGALILATGGREMVPEEYLYGKNSAVVTQRTFSKMLENDDAALANAQTVVMIQCVGSRDEKHPYCSRVCCGHAVKNALALKQKKRDTNIYVLNRDIRTYGFYEKKYQEARDSGVVFVRYDVSDKPKVSENSGALSVSFNDEIAAERIELKVDFVVLSTGIEPNDNAQLAEAAGVALNADGFFAEANPKSAPLDSVDRGKYFIGLCHSPNFIEDAILQGKAAAARVSSLLWEGEAEYADNQAYVNRRLCSGCGLCISACPYQARIMDAVTNTASVLEDLCKGCGTCVISCPNGASQQYDYERSGMFDVLDEILG